MNATEASETTETTRRADGRGGDAGKAGKDADGVRGALGRLLTKIQPLRDFWQKLSNDWVFNLSTMLAYNFLMSIFPLLLVLLAVAGFVLGALSAGGQDAVNRAITGALPSGTGQQLMLGAVQRLRQSAGLVFAIGLVTAAYSGSRLFTTIEATFGVVFRLRPRDFLHQNLMAFGMLALYAVLVPLIVLTSVFPGAIIGLLFPDRSALRDVLLSAGGVLSGVVAACLLFGATYVVVPNRPVPWREVWKGTLVAAVLLVLYEQLFPLYQQHFLKPDNYGSVAGFAVVILIFFYYFGFILLLGAEVNSWEQGQRQTAADIPSILHEVQAHDTTRGAAGPTAGTPQEDIQHHEGAAAMATPERAVRHEREEHDTDLQPPKFAEAGTPGPATNEPDSPHEARATAQAEQEATGKQDEQDQDGAHESGDGDQRRERGQGRRDREEDRPAARAAYARQPARADGRGGGRPDLTPQERAARQRRAFGALALTTGTALASIVLLLRRATAA